MGNSADNLEKLTYAVTSLNDDAMGMHELIQIESSHLEETIAIERRVSEDLGANAKALLQVVDLIPPRIESIEQLAEDVKAKTTAALDAAMEQSKTLKDEGLKAYDAMAASMKERHDSFEGSLRSFEEQSLKEAREARGELQADILNHKTAISARIDSLENEVVSLKSAIQGFDEKIAQTKEEVRTTAKPLLLLGLGVLVLEIVNVALTFVL